MSIGTMLWVESHRPDSLDDVALSEGNRALLESFIEKGEIPHLLLTGPPGCGKTTVADILLEHIPCNVLRMNASNERGIDTIRDKIGTFVRAHTALGWNIVFLDEADNMTRDAQAALRSMMETFSEISRFILTGNYPYKIIDALHSRCQSIALEELETTDRYRVLAGILDAEEVEYEPQAVLSYAERYTDLRKMISSAQKNVLSRGEGETLPPATESVVDPASVHSCIQNDDWDGLIEISKVGGFDHRQALIDLFYVLESASERAIVGKAVHESGFTPDPAVLFLGTCAELMQ